MQTALIWRQNGEINRLRKNAKNMVENQFNWNSIVNQLTDLYV